MHGQTTNREIRTAKLNPPDPQPFRHRRDADKTLCGLMDELVAARVRAGLTQQDVARRMGTTRSAISRLERALLHRPTLTTIENYALVVHRRIEIRVLPWP